MIRIMSKKYIGYAGQIAIVLVSLYLLYTVGMDFYLYDVESSGGTDDAMWAIPNERWDKEDTVGLFWWGFYLCVTGTHLFLYFKRLSSMKEFNMWALPTFNIAGMKILSGILSAFFLLSLCFSFILSCPKFIHQVCHMQTIRICRIIMETILSGLQ